MDAALPPPHAPPFARTTPAAAHCAHAQLVKRYRAPTRITFHLVRLPTAYPRLCPHLPPPAARTPPHAHAYCTHSPPTGGPHRYPVGSSGTGLRLEDCVTLTDGCWADIIHGCAVTCWWAIIPGFTFGQMQALQTPPPALPLPRYLWLYATTPALPPVACPSWCLTIVQEVGDRLPPERGTVHHPLFSHDPIRHAADPRTYGVAVHTLLFHARTALPPHAMLSTPLTAFLPDGTPTRSTYLVWMDHHTVVFCHASPTRSAALPYAAVRLWDLACSPVWVLTVICRAVAVLRLKQLALPCRSKRLLPTLLLKDCAFLATPLNDVAVLLQRRGAFAHAPRFLTLRLLWFGLFSSITYGFTSTALFNLLPQLIPVSDTWRHTLRPHYTRCTL